MTAPLKPCPFCGSPAKMSTGNSTYGRLWWAVWCDACEIELRDREVWDKTRPGMLDPAYPAGECVDRWNTRADAPELVALVAAAKGMRRIIEEIDGAMNHGTWRDEKGNRLKDTPEWVDTYLALKAFTALALASGAGAWLTMGEFAL